MKRFFTLFLAALMLFSLCACKSDAEKTGNQDSTTAEAPTDADTPVAEKELSPYEKLMAKYSDSANEQTSLAEAVAKKNDLTLLGKSSRLAIDLTDIASAITKAGENVSDEDFASLDAKLEKCKETLDEIKTLLEE